MSVPTPSGPDTSPVRVQPRHRAAVPVDPAYPDYPYFLDHDADARGRHLYGRGGRRWGRHPGFPALDDAVHLPAPALRPGQAGGELHPIGRLGAVALAAGAFVTAVTWVVAASDPPREVVAVLSLAWLVGYLAGCMWLEVAHANAVALAPWRQERRRTRSVWLAWFVPFKALWIPKRMVDDAMWTTARYALVRPVRWTGWWWTSFVLAALLSAAAVAVERVPDRWLWDAPGDVAALDAGLRVGAAVACSIALMLWVPIVRRLAIISDQLAEVRRSTLVR